MAKLQLDEYFTHPDDMRGASLQKQNNLMHKQLKSFETSLKQASDYYNPDELYNLITPIIPHGVRIISFDGLQRMVSQSKLSKGGRKIASQANFYFRAFLDDFLDYLDHLHQLKNNFEERIYATLFEYYYEIVFEDVKTTNQKKQPVSKRNLLKVFDLPKYAKFRKNFSKDFVSEIAADCENLSEIMISLQMLVRKWSQLYDDGDIDVSLFDHESEIDLQLYPNCDNFEAIIRYVPDLLHKSKQAHQLAYDWWCLAEKIRKKLTGQWKPKGPAKQRLEVPSIGDDGTSSTSSHSGTSGDTSSTDRLTSRTSSYHENCAPTKTENQWVDPSPIPSKLRRKDTFTYVPRAKKRLSYIPRRAVKGKNNNAVNNKQKREQQKSIHQTTQTPKTFRDACTSPMVATGDVDRDNKALIRQQPVHGYRVEEKQKYSYSDSEFEDEDETDLSEGVSRELYGRGGEGLPGIDNIEHLSFDIDEKVKILDNETRKLEATSHQEEKTQKLSLQVERAIRDIESLQKGLQDIEMEKDNLKGNMSSPNRDSNQAESLKENLEVLDNKLRNMAGLTKVNTYRQQLLASDVDLALELRGTFTRYNQEVKGKIELLERLIQEERKEQVRLEGEIQEMISQSNQENSNEHLSLRSVSSSSTPVKGEKKPTINEHEDPGKHRPTDSDDGDSLYDTDDIDDADMNIHVTANHSDQTNINSIDKSPTPHLLDQNNTPSLPKEELSEPNSAASQVSGENTKKRADSPSPKMYDNKRGPVARKQLEPIVKLPKIPESGHMVQQS